MMPILFAGASFREEWVPIMVWYPPQIVGKVEVVSFLGMQVIDL